VNRPDSKTADGRKGWYGALDEAIAPAKEDETV